MKRVARTVPNEQYWDRRWREAGRDPDCFEDLSIYPIRYAEMVMNGSSDSVLELGAGLGRVLKHYHRGGRNIVGLERSEVAVCQLKAEDPTLRIAQGDVTNLPYRDEQFDVVLAFGLYHNIEEGMDAALAETARCLREGGRFCISMRPDNIEMRLNEWHWRLCRRGSGNGHAVFHKWLVGEQEFRRTLDRHGLRTERIHRARNLSLLYRLPFLRAPSEAETQRRARGYALNPLGRALDRGLTWVLPGQFCNVLVYVGLKQWA